MLCTDLFRIEKVTSLDREILFTNVQDSGTGGCNHATWSLVDQVVRLHLLVWIQQNHPKLLKIVRYFESF